MELNFHLCPEMHETAKMVNLAKNRQMQLQEVLFAKKKSWRKWRIWQKC